MSNSSKIASSNKWLLIASIILAVLLILPYFSFLFRPIKSESYEGIIKTPNDQEKFPPSIDELLGKQAQ